MTLGLNDTARGGTGLLAVFVDLAPEDRADFRPWLAAEMFPPRIAIGFHAGASFDRIAGDGQAYVTLYDMPSLGHLYGAPYQGLRVKRAPKDAAYHEKFQNHARYTAAWAGPELSTTPGGFAPYAHIDRFDLAPDAAQNFNMWFAGTYLAALADLEGVTRVRRYLAMEGTPANIVLHEFDDPSVVETPAWSDLRSDFVDATSGLYRRVIHAP